MSRPMKKRCIAFHPEANLFSPLPKWTATGIVDLYPDEIEALRLVDYKGLTQKEAAERMGISRGTVWRLLHSGRKKVVAMIVEHRVLRVLKR